MSRINLLGGTYQARSIIADAQRCLNLYPEKNPEDASAPYTNLLTPGTVLKATPGTAGVARCLYTATNGSLYYVCGQNVYYIDSTWTLHLLGTLAANLTTPVAMQDNGLVIILVDGTTAGYAINLQTGIVGQPLAGQVTDAGSTASGSPGSVTITNAGHSGTNGTYASAALTGGSGTGATAALVVSNPFVSSSILGFVVSASTSVAHGLSPGDPVTISGYSTAPAINGNWICAAGTTGTTLKFTVSVGGSGSFPNNEGVLTTGGTGEVTSLSLNPTGTGYLVGDVLATSAVSGLTSEQFTVTAIGAVSGTYSNVPLSGGSGTGATGEFLVSGGVVIQFSLDNSGNNYVVGDVLGTSAIPGLGSFAFRVTNVGAALNAFAVITDPNFLGGVGIGYLDTFIVISQPNTRNWYSTLSNITYSELTGVAGQPLQGTIIAAGAGTAGSATFNAVALTGGSGTGATADITTVSGAVTNVVPLQTGLGYNAGDVLSASLSNTLFGFQYSLVAVNPPAFDPTYVAAKTGYPDLLSTLVVVHREVWLMGAYQSTEVWYDAGNTGFPFQIMPGVFIQHGCIAAYSVTTHDLNVFWLGVDQAGQGTVFMGAGYSARRISTYAIEKIVSNWVKAGANISDAVGFIYKQEDHVFYVLSSASANATIVFDVTENLWHERAWTDPNSGILNRVRANCAAFAYGVNVIGDWQNGNIYTLDLSADTDFGGPITRRRGFPHLLNDGKRHSIDRFALDMECGDGDASNITAQELVTLEVSIDRGRTYFVAPTQSMGAQGDYLFQMQWRQVTGQSRDFVFRVTWSNAVFTGISGAWIDDSLAET
jgi:hypothetical protein